LGGESLAVSGEVPDQVRPAKLALCRVEVLGDGFQGIACSDRWWAYDYVVGDRPPREADGGRARPA
jgi:hypothetical protein